MDHPFAHPRAQERYLQHREAHGNVDELDVDGARMFAACPAPAVRAADWLLATTLLQRGARPALARRRPRPGRPARQLDLVPNLARPGAQRAQDGPFPSDGAAPPVGRRDAAGAPEVPGRRSTRRRQSLAVDGPGPRVRDRDGARASERPDLLRPAGPSRRSGRRPPAHPATIPRRALRWPQERPRRWCSSTSDTRPTRSTRTRSCGAKTPRPLPACATSRPRQAALPPRGRTAGCRPQGR